MTSTTDPTRSSSEAREADDDPAADDAAGDGRAGSEATRGADAPSTRTPRAEGAELALGAAAPGSLARTPRGARANAIARQTTALVALVALVGVVVTGARFGAPGLVLFLAFAALAGAILLFWESARAVIDPNAPGDELALEGAGQVPSDLEVRKRAALRALKDIEFEHSIHRLSDEDFAVLRERYRAEARAAMEAIDKALSAYLPRAEALIAKAARGEVIDHAAAAAAASEAPTADEGDAARGKKGRRKGAKSAPAASASSATPAATTPAAATTSAPSSGAASALSAEPASVTASEPVAPAADKTPEPAAPRTDAMPALSSAAAPSASADAAPPVASSEPSAATTTTERRACASCGTSNDADAAFCKRCGAKVGAG